MASRQEDPAWPTCQRKVQKTSRRFQHRLRECSPSSCWAKRQGAIQGAKSNSNWWRVGARVVRKRLTWAAKLPLQAGKSDVIGQCQYCLIDNHATLFFMKPKKPKASANPPWPSAYRRLRARLGQIGWIALGSV